MDWQPIGSAPRDGSYVMVAPYNAIGHHGFTTARWGTGHFWTPFTGTNERTGWIERAGCFMGPQPTHWMPLLEPPDAP